MKERIYKTKVPIYGTCLHLIVTDDVAECARARLCDEDRNVLALTAWIKGVLTIMVPVGASVGMTAHEAFHAACEILDHHGAKWGKTNQEPIAYVLGWIIDWIARVLK
jgi:hypothetical protein